MPTVQLHQALRDIGPIEEIEMPPAGIATTAQRTAYDFQSDPSGGDDTGDDDNSGDDVDQRITIETHTGYVRSSRTFLKH